MTTTELGVGESLEVIHPGTDLTVTPVYSLDNTFTNETDWLMSFAITEAFLQLKLLGFAWDLVPFALPRDITLFEVVLPLGNPVTLGKLSDQSFSMQGFESVRGNSFVVAAAPVATPQPHALVLVGGGLAALTWIGRRRRRTR